LSRSPRGRDHAKAEPEPPRRARRRWDQRWPRSAGVPRDSGRHERGRGERQRAATAVRVRPGSWGSTRISSAVRPCRAVVRVVAKRAGADRDWWV